jgi:hypothetical protein
MKHAIGGVYPAGAGQAREVADALVAPARHANCRCRSRSVVSAGIGWTLSNKTRYNSSF